MNLSETTFVTRTSRADCDVRVRAVEIGSSAVPFLLIPLADLSALARARVDAGALARLEVGRAVTEVYPFVVLAPGEVRSRMFAPALGIQEDPATGGALRVGGACVPVGGGWLDL